jgi:hypothetical protein
VGHRRTVAIVDHKDRARSFGQKPPRLEDENHWILCLQLDNVLRYVEMARPGRRQGQEICAKRAFVGSAIGPKGRRVFQFAPRPSLRHSVLDDESLDPVRLGQGHAKTHRASVILRCGPTSHRQNDAELCVAAHHSRVSLGRFFERICFNHGTDAG